MSHLLPTFTRILARRPASNFADGITMSSHLGKPDYDNALKQYDTYIQSLQDLNLEVLVVPSDDRYPDGHFVEDPCVIFRDVAFMCRSGAKARAEEGESLKPYLSDLRVIDPPDGAYIDGGDVLICADRVLVGLSERTNEAGVDALRQAFQTAEPNILVEAVHFEGVLHLKSGLTELAPNVLIHDPALTTSANLSWATVITLPATEGYAADVMPVNDALFLAKGYPSALKVVQAFYDTVIELDMSEFQKMDGGLTCLSLRY